MPNEISTEGNDGSPCGSPRSDGHVEKKLTSRFRGVCWNRKNKRWQAAINHASKYIYLGSFVSEENAAKAFDQAAVKLRGHIAKTNFPKSDYQDEMSWHEALIQTGKATETVLNNPRCLRDKGDMPMGMAQLVGTLTTPPFLSHPPCNFSQSVYHHQTVGRVEPLHGRVIGTQGQPVINGASPMYCYNNPGDVAIGTMPMSCGVFGDNRSELLSPASEALTSAPFGLSNPAVRMEPTMGRPWLGVMPQDAQLTHVFQSPQNAFAMGYVRPDAVRTEVVVYDGHYMHDVGSFSSKDDAAQASQSLLKIVDKFSAANVSQPASETRRSPSQGRASTEASTQVHESLESDPGLVCSEELEGKSPFEVPPGSRPSFDTEDADDDRLDIPQKFDRPTIDIAQRGLKGKTNSAPLDPKSGSLEQRMGSLLHLEQTFSVGRLNGLAPAAPTSSCRPGGYKSESSVRVITSQTLKSGSLQNILSLFHSIKKDDSEDEAVDTPFSVQEPAHELSLSCSQGLPPTSTPVLANYPQPYLSIQHSEQMSLYVSDGPEHCSPFLKRKPGEMILQNQACKKLKAHASQNMS